MMILITLLGMMLGTSLSGFVTGNWMLVTGMILGECAATLLYWLWGYFSPDI